MIILSKELHPPYIIVDFCDRHGAFLSGSCWGCEKDEIEMYPIEQRKCVRLRTEQGDKLSQEEG